MSAKLKKSFLNSPNPSTEHVEEFGDCEGIVQGLTDWGGQMGPEVDVRWQPSNLRYAYDPKLLDVVGLAPVVADFQCSRCDERDPHTHGPLSIELADSQPGDEEQGIVRMEVSGKTYEKPDTFESGRAANWRASLDEDGRPTHAPMKVDSGCHFCGGALKAKKDIGQHECPWCIARFSPRGTHPVYDVPEWVRVVLNDNEEARFDPTLGVEGVWFGVRDGDESDHRNVRELTRTICCHDNGEDCKWCPGTPGNRELGERRYGGPNWLEPPRPDDGQCGDVSSQAWHGVKSGLVCVLPRLHDGPHSDDRPTEWPPWTSPSGHQMPHSDAVLLENAVRSAHRGRLKGIRWGHVVDVLCVGSTSAIALCRRYGLDPEEDVGSEAPGLVE